MRFTRAAVLGTVMAAGMVTAPPPAAGAAEAAQAQVKNAITLITGDRVIVSGPPGRPSYQVEAGAGRRVSFSIGTWGGHTHVIPSDAAALVGRGLVDRRLFDVTQLLEWRYDDASRPDIPIMTQGGAAPKAAEAGRSVATVGLSAARVDKARAATVWQELGRGAGARTLAAGVTKLWLDGRLSYSLEKSVAQIGAPDAWRRGLSGKGVTVAVLDTGYDPAHPDLQGVVTQSANFSDEPDIVDNVGHGTHVASIVAGSGQASGGRYRGVAPDAKIAVGKVGGAKGIHESAVIAGMEWAATQAKADVVNVSLGAYDTEEIDPMEQAVNTLSERTGTLFVVAAGNDSVRGTISSPGSADAALTVGAVDGDDQRASFSSQGPRAGDRAVKPDITAPGVRITAAAAKGAYVAYSGTSMAAPHVAGAAAILAQLHPGWSGAQIKAALMSSARPGAGLTPYEQGVGRVDVARAVTQPVTADSPNLWVKVPWPPTGVPLTEEITYTNTSSEPVELTLTSDGPFTLSADRLSVPANGRAAVTLTLPADLKTGVHPGKVTATSGDLTVRSLAGAFVEPEYHTVTLTAIGRTGEPVDNVMASLYNLETGEYEELFGFEGGTAKVRVPSGEWHLRAHLFEMSALTTMSKAVHVGSQDEQVTIDAREGRPVRFSLDDPAAQPVGFLQLSTRVTRDGRSAEAGLVVSPGPEQTVYVIPVSYPGLEFMALSAWEKSGTPATRYDLADYRTGGIPSDPGVRARTADLARVTATFRAQAASSVPAAFERSAAFRDGGRVMFNGPTAVQAPGTLINYVTPHRELLWHGQFGDASGAYQLSDEQGRALRRGHHAELWNAAVTGPAAPTLTRTEDVLHYTMDGLFTDSGTGRTGWDGDVTGTVTLRKDGDVLHDARLENCRLDRRCGFKTELAGAAATYTLGVSARRDVPHSSLTTAIDSVWTFTSGRATGTQALDLPSVKYTPEGLDAHNRAMAGSDTRITVAGDGEALRTLQVEASFDDGRTWRPLRARPAAGVWKVSIDNPSTSGFVSLRATAGDDDGDRVSQTILRAYAVQG